jgi:hypothetical protein
MLGAWGGPLPAAGEVVRVVVERREDVLGGRAWGSVGAYEKLVGRIFFAFDPANPANGRVADLALAPRNANGHVEAYAEFFVLQPKDPEARRGVAWLEVSNRGGKASLRYFNRAATSALDPTTAADFGDGLLFREGLTLIWVGWQWDVPNRDGLLRLHVPFARVGDRSIHGLARADWTVDRASEVLDLAHRGHRAYAAAAPDDERNVLTVRDGRDALRRVVPRERWTFLPAEEGPEAGRLTRIRVEGGFEAGRIYELVYVVQDPRIVGLGLAAVRDVASYAKYSLDSEFPAESVLAFGVSQTGRFLRHYLYQGFNTDERGRKAVDGMLVHTAGAGRGSFNHRFGQPSRDAHRYSAFFFPTDLFPFTSRSQLDAATDREAGLLDLTAEAHRPRTFFTNTGYEYWGRAASLIHTSPDGARDVEPLATERIYHLASAQHSAGRFPPAADSEAAPGVYRGNPLDLLVTLRALAIRLVRWVADDVPPPPSRYPTLGSGTLVSVPAVALPSVPGLARPEVAHVAYRADYGPRFFDLGIVDREPPDLAAPYPSLVPQVDGLGNELGGIRGVELRVPVATYLPWNLRGPEAPGSPEELSDFIGTWVPLSPDDSTRVARADSRPSLRTLYPTRAVYRNRVRLAAGELAEQGFLLAEDVAVVVMRAEAMWDWIHGPEGRTDPGATSYMRNR